MKLRPAREKRGSECLTGVCREVHVSAHRWPGCARQVGGEPSHKERTRQYKWNSGVGRLGGSVLEAWVLIVDRSGLVEGKREGLMNPGLQRLSQRSDS